MPPALTRVWPVIALLCAAACGGSTAPAMLDTHGAETCASCRMTIASTRTAAQVVARDDVPLFFDDLGCLRDYIHAHATPADAVTYVADHNTGAWVVAAEAIYARAPGVSTPMGSHLVAWASETSRESDATVRDGEPVVAATVIGTQGDRR